MKNSINLIKATKLDRYHLYFDISFNALSIKMDIKALQIWTKTAFWVKTKGSETWKMLISTDTDITFTNDMKFYHMLWSIEVFFKEYKQN